VVDFGCHDWIGLLSPTKKLLLLRPALSFSRRRSSRALLSLVLEWEEEVLQLPRDQTLMILLAANGGFLGEE
jgi:hypothetical protein